MVFKESWSGWKIKNDGEREMSTILYSFSSLANVLIAVAEPHVSRFVEHWLLCIQQAKPDADLIAMVVQQNNVTISSFFSSLARMIHHDSQSARVHPPLPTVGIQQWFQLKRTSSLEAQSRAAHSSQERR